MGRLEDPNRRFPSKGECIGVFRLRGGERCRNIHGALVKHASHLRHQSRGFDPFDGAGFIFVGSPAADPDRADDFTAIHN
jgi:hypothetical protein